MQATSALRSPERAPTAPARPARVPRRPVTEVIRAGIATALPREPLLRNGHLLAMSSLINAALGAVFWVCATRWYDDEVVGLSYSALSAATLLAAVGQLNLNDFLVRFVPSAGRNTRRLIIACYLISALCTVLAAVGFLLLVPRITPGLDFLLSPATALCFVVATAGYAIFVLQDGALTAVSRPVWVVTENMIFAVVKIVLLAVGAVLALFTGILASWAGALLLAVVVTNFLLLRRAVPRHEQAATARAERPPRMIGYAAADYAGSMFRMAAYTFVPLLVLNSLGAEQSAYFSLAWIVGYMLYLVVTNMGSSMMVESAHDPERLTEHAYRVLRHSALLMAAAAGATFLLAPQILSVFGPEYAEHGTTLLRLVALSALPNLLVSLAVDVARMRRLMRAVVGLQLALFVLVLGLSALLLPVMGLSGAGIAWLTAQSLLALYLLIRRSHWLPTPVSGAPAMNTEPERTSGTDLSRTDISVVICVYTEDRWEDILAAVESVRAQSHPALETLLVVDHNPVLRARLAAAYGPAGEAVRVLANTGPRGLSAGRNTGIRSARGSVVAFLDDDAVAEEDWLRHFAAGYADPRVMAVGGRTVPAWASGRRPAWFPAEFDWVVGCTYRGLPEGTVRVRNVFGGNASFRRSVFDTAGGFATGIGRDGDKRPLGCEETELCIRLTRADPDAILLIDDRAVIHHKVPASRERLAYFTTRTFAEGLSKALVTRSVGADEGLASERRYTTRVLPAGVVRGLRDTLAGRPGGAGRAGAIVVGLVTTTCGYLVGSVRARRGGDAVTLVETPLRGDQPPGEREVA